MDENQILSAFNFTNDAIEYMKKKYQDLILFSDDFAKPYSPKRISSESPKDINNNENKSLDLF